MSAFRLSRVYAEGWNMARKLPAAEIASAVQRNPYSREPERSRWNEGFTLAVTTTERSL